MSLRVLMIDNFDSFTYNLVDEFSKRGCTVTTLRNSIALDDLNAFVKKTSPQLIVLSPGPGSPREAGICIPLIQEFQGKIPMLGVCLGHQAMVEALGGSVGRAEEIVHGKTSFIFHDGKGLFEGLGSPLSGARYHSLCASRLPEMLEVTARTEEGMIMGVKHRDSKTLLEGVQFHPESVLTTQGGKMIENLIRRVGGGACKP
ncbi:MAG: aminodeoxychorismate/anthranilate synthase component II [Nanoarchaeota archaeon]|nr:aminodeoxychorismate/anthranilate synthase component II [Nanoarchaeota archaeon]